MNFSGVTTVVEITEVCEFVRLDVGHELSPKFPPVWGEP